ncbi:MAG: glycosyltransferase family 2 protein [Paraprevotella sp.]|nr:glycosyltransferase family 2 protein [Paraprevotella sp.]
MMNGFSVIMPTYNQAYFIRRAVMSLIRQSYPHWELIIVNDGSTDHTDRIVRNLPQDERIKYLYYPDNRGMGYALNKGLDAAQYGHIAYLPSDDFFYADHLKDLKEAFDTDERVILAYSGGNFDDTDAYAPRDYTDSLTIMTDHSLQLVQTAHRKTADLWTERQELVTSDLFVMFWHRLTGQGIFMPTLRITAKWTNHPWQRHKICGEDFGGNLYRYKDYYQIKEPIRIRMNRYRILDENETYSPVAQSVPGKPLMKILIIGVLNYHPERFCAWEEAGCQLYGYWYPTPSMAHESIGPFPFGHIETIPHGKDWTERVREIRPDLIYLCFCCSSLEFVYDSIMELRKARIHTPFIWHLKEGPQLCMRFGTWPKLMELYELSAGNIITNEQRNGMTYS